MIRLSTRVGSLLAACIATVTAVACESDAPTAPKRPDFDLEAEEARRAAWAAAAVAELEEIRRQEELERAEQAQAEAQPAQPPPPSAPAPPPREVRPMNEREFLRLFHIVEHDRGPRYVRARDRLVREGERARPHLVQHLSDPDPWRVQAAQVVLGWIDHREDYERCSGYLLGEITIVLGDRWRVPDQAIVGTVQAMQPLVVPRMIELLVKTDEIPYYDTSLDAFQPWSLMVRSMSWDRRFLEPCVARMLDRRLPMRDRFSFAEMVQDYRDPRGLEFAMQFAWNRRADADHRRAAFAMLAREPRPDQLPRIRAALQDSATPEPELLIYVSAASYFNDRASADLLLSILRRARSPDLRFEVLDTLNLFQELRAMPDVERLAASDPDERVRRQAASTLDDLRSLEISRQWQRQP